jgi:small GTP-binding protein
MNTAKSVTLKYLVVGDSGVGKTSLLVRYCEDSFQTDYLSTIGVDFKIKRMELNHNQVTLNIWDTAGQERFRNITKSFYKGAHGIILTFSITDPVSFNHIESWIDQIKEVGNADTDMILVGAKSDLESDRKVSRKQAETLADKYSIQYVEVSAKEDTNISRVFEMLTQQVIERLKLDEKSMENNTTTLTGKKE